jgi:type II secretory pathway pseudopilin PulG
LLEVLVALLILSMSLGAIFGVFGSAAGMAERVRTERSVAALAQSQLARVGREIPLAPTLIEGTTADGFTWKVDIEPYREADKEPPRTLLPFRVAVTAARGTHRFSMVTLRLAVSDDPSGSAH